MNKDFKKVIVKVIYINLNESLARMQLSNNFILYYAILSMC